MGVGATVGAGIFALPGEAGSIAGSAVYISFIVGGIVALSSAYTLTLGWRMTMAANVEKLAGEV